MLLGTETVCAAPDALAMAVQKLWSNMKNGESVVMTKWSGSEQSITA